MFVFQTCCWDDDDDDDVDDYDHDLSGHQDTFPGAVEVGNIVITMVVARNCNLRKLGYNL